MQFFLQYIDRFRDLLQTEGWRFSIGLLLCLVLRVIVPKRAWSMDRFTAIALALLGGACLPMCNFAVILPTICMLSCGSSVSTALTFLAAGVLLNPAGLILSWAYMGPVMTILYGMSALLTALAVGLPAMKLLDGERQEISCHKTSDITSELRFCLMELGPKLALWILIGILLEAMVLTAFPSAQMGALLLDPAGISAAEAVVMGLFHHVCIPDDLSLTASLVASGLTPGKALLFLLIGVGSNLPELSVLWGLAGKKTALWFAGISTACGVIFCMLAELLITPHFVPKYSLTGAEQLAQLANTLSVRTWMPARIPCAVFLFLLGLYGLWKYSEHRKK